MKNFLLIAIVVLTGSAFYLLVRPRPEPIPPTPAPTIQDTPQPQFLDSEPAVQTADAPSTSIISTGLDTPWAIAFLPDKSLLVTERMGTVRFIDNKGILDPTPIATIQGVKEIGEGGLMGIALHPEYATNGHIYFYYTYSGTGNNTLNRVVRMTYKDKQLSDEKIIVDQIPGAANHNGGRIKFGADKQLYITTGDAQDPSAAQNTNSLAGKILRVTDEGTPSTGNLFNNAVYSYGHRNPQGITWDNSGQLWSTEHGPSGIETGNDEVNKIQAGGNYGWPTIRGTQTRAGMIGPVVESGTKSTWAPGGVAFINGKLYFAGLRGTALYEFEPSTNKLRELLKNEFGRIRETIAGPDGLLYITTSNKDGRGSAQKDDDKVIRVNPQKI